MEEKLICRLCSSSLNYNPSFILENLPLGVQYFPDTINLENDKSVRLEIFYCSCCGLVQAFGNQVVYENENSAATSISPAMTAHKMQQARDFIDKYNLKGKKILEAGCGDGHFLEMLTKAGAKLAVGVEPSVKSKESSLFKDVVVYSDYITANNILVESPFDAFATFHVMEHIPNIHDFISGISTNLIEGGIGLVEVPSSELIEEDFRFYDLINDHLNYFTLRTLSLAFRMHNFEILEEYRNWNGEHNVLIVRKGKVFNFSSLEKKKIETISNLTGLLDQYQDCRVAIWGASMHALTLLSQFKSNKIKYVIDSAQYKQNRFTPASHYPIFAASELETNTVDLVVIIAPRFENEIVEGLKNNTTYKGHIAVLSKDKVCLL